MNKQSFLSHALQKSYAHRKILAGWVCCFYLCLAGDLSACSRVFWNDISYKLVARTMDLDVDEQPLIQISPRGLLRIGCQGKNPLNWRAKYGSLAITAFRSSTVSEGINEKGLAAHILYLDATKYAPKDNLKKLSNGLWVQFLIDNFASVNEAISHLNQFRLVSRCLGGREYPLHACIEDATGDSAILEYINGRLYVYHGPQHRVLTNDPTYAKFLKLRTRYANFGGTRPLPTALSSVGRFLSASAKLQALPKAPNLAGAKEVLVKLMQTVCIPHQPNARTGPNPWPTRWISLCDLTHKVYHFLSTSGTRRLAVQLKKINFSAYLPVRYLNPHDPLLSNEINFDVLEPVQNLLNSQSLTNLLCLKNLWCQYTSEVKTTTDSRPPISSNMPGLTK